MYRWEKSQLNNTIFRDSIGGVDVVFVIVRIPVSNCNFGVFVLNWFVILNIKIKTVFGIICEQISLGRVLGRRNL